MGPLQLHPQRLVDPQTLPDAKIEHDLLRSTRDLVAQDVSVQPLDLGSLSAPTDAQTAEDLRGLFGAKLKRRGRLCLQAGDGAAKLQHGLRLVHLLALVDDVLEPVVGGFDLACHVSELESDDGMVDELLAEGVALVRIFHRFFVTDAREAETLDDYADTLVIEVRHED